MGQYYYLEFYIPKEPLERSLLTSAFDAMEQEGFSILLTKSHPPLFGDSETSASHLGRGEFTIDEAIDIMLAERGGSISFEHGLFHARLSVYASGWIANRNRAKELGESETGEVPFGTVRFAWEHMSAKSQNMRRFQSTLDLGRRLYRVVNPVFGYFHLGEVYEPSGYNLIPTEWNILRHGPKDLFPINFWAPKIARTIEWRSLRNIATLSVVQVEDGGVLLNLIPEQFAFGNYDCLREGERLLGWIE